MRTVTIAGVLVYFLATPLLAQEAGVPSKEAGTVSLDASPAEPPASVVAASPSSGSNATAKADTPSEETGTPAKTADTSPEETGTPATADASPEETGTPATADASPEETGSPATADVSPEETGTPATADASPKEITPAADAPLNDDPDHNRGVELARQGKHQEGLQILQMLLDKKPYNYEVRRDFVIISRWAGECEQALENYDTIVNHPKKESYLLAPVAECMNDMDRPEQAINLLKTGLTQWPDDEELKALLQRLQTEKQHRLAPVLSFSGGINESDQGNREWYSNLRYEQRFFYDELRAYTRYSVVRADDPQFETGDLNRVGIGLTYRHNYQWTLDYEYSQDTERSGEEGNTAILIYKPHYLWEMSLEYASHAEDLPLRAKALGVESDRTVAAFSYHSADYQWTGNMSYSHYDFSDTNQRKTVYGAVAYAFELKHEREQRLRLELYRGSNSLREDVVYYNPEDEVSAGLAYRADFVYDSSFQRHVDHIELSMSNYIQQNYSADMTYGLSLGQEYDFNDQHSLSYRLSYSSKVYDGNREQQPGFDMSYAYRF
ncbi:MAG: hypothetical protein OEZ68_16990 [Gammaproteobacteria bacterium]|nr:hypothetical protein [Gammaproteobacteria bacterium]MDH5802499.1 hypothetical protein [Gammaproteobacteria bacterium]